MYGITANRIRELFPDFLNMFDVVTLSAEIGLKKPNPEIFLRTLQMLNGYCKLNGNHQDILPEEVMMVGDKQDKDVDPAIALGMQAKLIDRNTQNLNDVLNGRN